AAALQRVKRSQTEVPALLRRICEEPGVREALLLNTCQRFELYVSRDTAVCPEAEELAKRLRSLQLGDRRSLEGPGGPFGDLPLNVVHDDIAWHHLVRTVAGLSSNLPGERDVLDQLLAAHRLASCAQAAGPRMDELVRGVEARVQRLREETPWGRFTADYALAAMSGIVTGSDLNLTLRRIVVIGGSTTSAGVLHTLREHFDVPDRQLTLFYRGHKRGHLKDLRRAIGGGRRVRVQSYDQRCVVEAIREADVVVLGLDRTEPVVTSEALRGLRDFSARPLTVFDFNLFGSTRGLRSLPGAELYDAGRLDAEVARFAEARRHAESFRRAVDEAEAWIQHEVRALRPGSDAESPLGTAGAEGDAGRRHVGHATPVAALVCERMVS
ncbi:MAG: hypothetical protein ACE5EX_10125, partial [Phycisphaerae bacterium]